MMHAYEIIHLLFAPVTQVIHHKADNIIDH